MTPTPNCAVPAVEPPQQPADQQPEPVLAAAVDIARAAAAEEAGAEQVGRHVGVEPELDGAATHLFDAELPGYRGWRWAVTVASAGPDTPVTVSEVVLLPGPDALTAPEWVPWQQRVQAGDLGVGDLMPTAPEDPRLVPGYLESDDEAVEEVALELGLGRARVLSRFGRLDSAERWQTGDFGPRSDMARGAPDRCGRCGFYLPVAGSLRAAFGVCANELSPADGRVVHVEYGCGAHSEVELDLASPVPVADLVYDDTTLDVEHILIREPAADSAPAESVSTDFAPAESVPAEPIAIEAEGTAQDAAEVIPDTPAEADTSEAVAVAEPTQPDEPTEPTQPDELNQIDALDQADEFGPVGGADEAAGEDETDESGQADQPTPVDEPGPVEEHVAVDELGQVEELDQADEIGPVEEAGQVDADQPGQFGAAGSADRLDGAAGPADRPDESAPPATDA